jgi:hypothetical protein
MAQTDINITGNVKNWVSGEISLTDQSSIHIGDQYLSYSTALLRQALYLIPKEDSEVVPPSNAEQILDILSAHHLVILSAPSFWRSSYVAEYLAFAIHEQYAKASEDPQKRENIPIYSLTSEASGEALLDALRDKNNKLYHAVIIASGVLPDKYSGNLLTQLAHQATVRDAYLILTTEESQSQWENALSHSITEEQLVDLRTHSPYTDDDLVQWLMNSHDLSQWIEQAVGQPRSADQTISGTNLTLHKIATELGSPGAIQQFLNAIRAINTELAELSDIQTLFNHVMEQRERSSEQRVEEWFNNLEESEKYLVLAISLLDGLQQETFWAIYEQLTQNAWRERDMQLAMTDYHDIEVKLDQFVSATGDRVSFHNAEERRKLVAYALDGYRRSLVQALPVLADIVSGANQPVAHETGSLAGKLRVLDIFGSELEPTGENRQRQERLRNSIANSIAQIAQREPSTTEHLLLAWASGVGDPASEIVNMRLRIAVIITLVQMLTIVSPEESAKIWYEKHRAFWLLGQWYERYNARQTVAYSQTAIATEDRHRNIRGTMALALCHLGRHMSVEDFGHLSEESELTNKVPDRQPRTRDLKSPWDMLLALAWDSDTHVRSSILEGIPLLAQRHLDHAETLIKMLASDWRATVRIEVAEMLASLYTRNSSYMYIINYLFNMEEDIIARHIPQDANHYMRRDAVANQYPYQLHLWTATMTLFFIAQQDEAAFHVYFDTLLKRENEQENLYCALEDVVRFVLADTSLIEQFRDSALLYLLTHVNPDNSPSRMSQLLATEIRTYVVHTSIERNTASFRTMIGALARGRYSGLSEPSIIRLRNDLSRVQIRNEGILELLQDYVSSSNEQVRRRVQHILHIRDNFANNN